MAGVDISIIVPCYNEERHIVHLLDAIFHQTIPLSRLEVVIADGNSTDNTRLLVSNFQASHPDMVIRVIENPKRNIPSALNLAINAAVGVYIIRMDAHSIPEPNYVELSIHHLEEGIADNIGGVWIIQPGDDTEIALAISIAAAHPLGVGGAQYRNTNAKPGFVDTVPFGAYKKEYLNFIGRYNEALLSNEDYELNTRIRAAGGKIYLDPEIRTVYFARNNLRKLAKQYFRYGYWKLQMLKRFPKSIRLRQLLPPILVITFITLLVLCVTNPLFSVPLISLSIIYTLSIFFGTYLAGSKQRNSFVAHAQVTAAVITMHTSWGVGFLVSPFYSIFKAYKNGK